MAKIFIVLSFIASVAAGWYGYQTKVKIDEVNKNYTATKADLKDTKNTLTKTKDQLTDTQTQLKKSTDDLAAKTAEALAIQAKLDDTTTKLTDATTQVTDLTGKLADANKMIDDLKVALSGTNTKDPGNPQGPIAELKAQLAEAQQLNKSLQDKATEADARASKLAAEKAHQQAITLHPGIEGIVMAVNPGYNFTVISLGDRQGAAPSGEVLVKRGDLMIAKLKITSVEPTTSIADIIPDTLAKGMHVQPGDKVIFTGLKVQ